MAVCDCSSIDVSENCILNPINRWTPTFAVPCIECYFAVPLQTEYQVCNYFPMETLKDELVEMLAYPGTCEKLYEVFVDMHTGIPIGQFMNTYYEILTGDDFLEAIYVSL